MGNLRVDVFLLVFLHIFVKVHSNCVNGLTKTDVTGDSCAVYLVAPFGSDTESMCGWIDGAAAQRACWDLGKGTTATGTRHHRCVPMTEGSLTALGGGPYTDVTGGQIGFGCDNGGSAPFAVNCFLGCYESTAEGTPDGDVCEGATTEMAVGCEDIDECVDGALINCDGPFDHDCERVPACGPNTVCTNDVNSGWTCACRAGGWDPADVNDRDIGCIDVDECDPATPAVCATVNGIESTCQNTPGSYTCVCDAGHWSDEANGCIVSTCDEYELRTMENSNGWEGDMSGNIDDYEDTLQSTCDEGYEPRASDTVRSTCRYDGTWCQCDSVDCKRKKCDVPHMDGNAVTSPVDGVTQDTIEYHCLEGFKAESGDSYKLDCDNNGVWETLDEDDRCTDEDECDYNDKCPEHSDCINTIGSYHCLCHYGYDGDECDERISCGEIPDVQHADRITHIGEVNGEYEMVVSYRCEEGYHVSTEITYYKQKKEFEITCKVTKSWNPIPECIPISCGDPGIINHASREGHSFYYDSEVTYTCYDGFRRSDYDTYDSALSYGVSIKITCEEKGWSSKAHCVDIDECKKLTHPCGSGLGHLCVNTEGGFTCSCAAGYRLDSTGRRCIALPDQEHEIEEGPCDVYHAYGLCHDGRCQFDGYGIPECVCNPGFIGAFCDRHDEFDFTIPFIISIVGIVIGGLVLIMALVLVCCVLTKYCNNHHDDRDSAVYGHHAHPKLHQKPLGPPRAMFSSVMSRGIPCLDC